VGRLRLLDSGGQRRGDPFTALAEAIVHQQVSMKAAATIFGRLRRALGGRAALDPGRLLRARPDQLRAAGLSRQKAGYLRDLAEKTLSGALQLERLERMDDEQVIRQLTRVKGIGRWSAEMYLIFRIGRLDVLPTDDLGLRKGAQQLYNLRQLPTAATLGRLARPWVPFRTIATWYLWRSLDAGGL
jgi:3-methyladenine DNA glycosylase/8-oxoguanine DNA glycosylase